MRGVTVDELGDRADAAREEIWDIAARDGHSPKIYLHWSAGHYLQRLEEYHVNITADGRIDVTTDSLADVLART